MAGERKEDISVRIVADYAKALADVQRFTGSIEKSFDALPKVVQILVRTVDQATDSLNRLGRSDGPEQVRRRLVQTNQEANQLSKTFDKLLLTGRSIGAAMAAWQAGKAVLAPVVNATMDYGMRLTQATNITAIGGTLAEKFKVMDEINTRLEAARRAGGGRREDILAGYESLTARNAIGNKDQTLQVMPGIAITATAGNASVEDIAKTTAGLVKSLGVAPKDNEQALAQLLYAGQIGGFELKNMAHYLPAQSASAKNAGLSGMSAVAKIAALNELAIDYSGTPDQAGINVGDFLNSMNSSHLANNLKRFSFDKKNNALIYNQSKRKGINYLDLGHQLAENAANGVDSIDTVLQLTGMVMKGDPKYAAAVKKRDAAKQRLDEAKQRGDSTGQVAAQQELTAITESVVQILEGRGIGKLFHNQQELRGAIGVLTNPGAYHAMVDEIKNKGTLGNRDNAVDFIRAQPGFKAQMYDQEKSAALYTGMGGFNNWIGRLAEGFSNLYQKHPQLAAAMEGGKVTIMTLGAAAGAASIVMALLTRNAAHASAALGGIGGAGGAAGGAGGAGAASTAAGRFASGLKISGALSALVAASDVFGIYNDSTLSSSQKKIGYTRAAGGALGGTLGGATVGAAAGSFFPGIGTAIGGVIGAGLGYWGGNGLGTKAGEAMFGDGPAVQSPKMPSFSENVAVNKQMLGFGTGSDGIKRALTDAMKPQPVDVRLKLDLGISENGQPYVKKQSVSGAGVRLDTGPMMTY